MAVVDKSTDEIFLTRTRGAAPEGRILQVWAHGPGEPAMSVGLWPEGDTIRLPMPETIAAVEGRSDDWRQRRASGWLHDGFAVRSRVWHGRYSERFKPVVAV